MALDALRVPITLDDSALGPALNRAGSGISSFARGASGSLGDVSRAAGGVGRALNDNVGAFRAHGSALAGSNIAMMEATHIAKSLAEQIGAGVSPFRALSMEGGRLVTLFQYGGGVSGVLSSAAALASRLANPFALGAGAVAAFTGSMVYALSTHRSLMNELQSSTMGAGAMTGLNAQGLGALAASSGQRTGYGYAQSVQNAATLARSGAFDAPNLSTALNLTPGIAAAYGLDATGAASKAASLFSDPAKGLDELQHVLGPVSERTRQAVASLEAQGDAQGALRVVLDATSTSLHQQTQQLSWWQKSMRDLSGAADAVGSLFDPLTARQQYNHASAGAGMGMIGRFGGGPDANNLAEDMRNAALLQGARPDFMLSEGQAFAANLLSQRAAPYVDRLLPQVGQARTLTDQRTAIQAMMANPNALSASGLSADQAGQAVAVLNDELRKLSDPVGEIGRQSQAAIAVTQAQTGAARIAAQYQRDYAEALDRTHNSVQAAATAEAKRNEAVAVANRQAEDAARSTSQATSLIGLLPAQRIQQQYQNDLDNARRQYGGLASSPGSSVPLTPPGSAGTVTGAQLAMMQAYVARGYSPAAAAGFVGATTTESGVDLSPSALNRTSGAYGVFQDLGNRKSSLLATGDLTFGGQIANSLNELSGPERAAGRMLASSDTVLGGVLASDAFERPGDAEALRRRGTAMSRANALLAAYQGGAAVGGSSAAGGASFDVQATALTQSRDRQMDELFAGPKRNAELALDERNAAQVIVEKSAALNKYGVSAGAAAGKIAEMMERQSLINDLYRSGVKDVGPYSERIDALASGYGAAAKRAADFSEGQQRAVSDMDNVRGFTSDSMSSLFSGLARGQSFHSLVDQIGMNAGDRLIRGGVGSVTDGLFGRSGQSGGGLLGGLLGSLFGGHMFAGGTDDAPGGPAIVGEKGPEVVNLPAHAQVVPNSTLANLRGAPPAITLGDVHFHAVTGSVFSDEQMAALAQNNARVQQQMAADIVRNMSQYQADAQQSAIGR